MDHLRPHSPILEFKGMFLIWGTVIMMITVRDRSVSGLYQCQYPHSVVYLQFCNTLPVGKTGQRVLLISISLCHFLEHVNP
jgi:hypothetical protein